MSRGDVWKAESLGILCCMPAQAHDVDASAGMPFYTVTNARHIETQKNRCRSRPLDVKMWTDLKGIRLY